MQKIQSPFNYLYRDAGNFKVRGTIALLGRIDDVEVSRVEAALEGGEFFIAEQVGVPQDGEIGPFVERFVSVERWKEHLSPEFGLA